MPLTFANRSRVLVAPRGVIAFAARDGDKSVCCLVPTGALERYFGAQPGATMLRQTFDLHRPLIEEAASALYDRVGSDECGELRLSDGDLGRREGARLIGALGTDHGKALAALAARWDGRPNS